jgi:zinc/manganese transport system substrate-binding protein
VPIGERYGAVARVALFLALAASLSLAGAGCGTATGARPTTSAKPMLVVSSIDTWGSILGQLGGARVTEVSIVSSPEVDSRHYRPTRAELRTIAAARVLVVNGIGYDQWATAAARAHPSSSRVLVDVGSLVGPGAGGNPHQAYSRTSVGLVVDAVTRALQRADPPDRQYFSTRRARFEMSGLGPLRALESAIRQKYAGEPIGASSAVAEPLASSLDLKLVTPLSFVNAIATGNTPSPADLATMNEQISDHRIRVYLDDVQHSTPEVVAEVRAAEKADVPVVTLTETLSPKDATFQAWQVQQLTALRTALQQKS